MTDDSEMVERLKKALDVAVDVQLRMQSKIMVLEDENARLRAAIAPNPLGDEAGHDDGEPHGNC